MVTTQPTIPPRGILVSDYDGTITRHDFYELAAAELVPADTPDYWGQFLGGGMTVYEVLSRIFRAIRAEEQAILDVARRCELSPSLALSLERLRAAGWRVVVASAGCGWYIERMLAEVAGAGAVEIYANPGELLAAGDARWKLEMSRPPRESPFFSEKVGIDKAAVVRAQLAIGCPVAFAGDGKPDLPASLLVPPERRFARAALADQLTGLGERFRPFEDWGEVATALLSD